MASAPQPQTPPPSSNGLAWLGWIFSGLAGLGLLASGVIKIMIVTKAMEPPPGSDASGWSASAMFGLALLEIGCALLYLFPPTSILGAIVATGYLGGAVATHERIGDELAHVATPMVLGVILWLGLVLRCGRLRAILPWRGSPSAQGGFLSALGKIVLTLLVLLLVIAGLIEAQPAAFTISRSTTIDAPPAQVFEQVNDFHNWDAWSPWAKIDPKAKFTYEGPSEGTGAIVKWSGDYEGTMTILESQPSERIKIKLDFVKPLPSTSDVVFTFKGMDDKKTAVAWIMSGERDFPAKAIGAVMNMDKIVGADFDKGLASMKSVVEAKRK